MFLCIMIFVSYFFLLICHFLYLFLILLANFEICFHFLFLIMIFQTPSYLSLNKYNPLILLYALGNLYYFFQLLNLNYLVILVHLIHYLEFFEYIITNLQAFIIAKLANLTLLVLSIQVSFLLFS